MVLEVPEVAMEMAVEAVPEVLEETALEVFSVTLERLYWVVYKQLL